MTRSVPTPHFDESTRSDTVGYPTRQDDPADALTRAYDRAVPLTEIPLHYGPIDPRPGDPVVVEIRGTLAYRRRGQIGVWVDGWAAPVALHLIGDPGMGVPNPPAPDITVKAAPPVVLTPGQRYTARGDRRTFFAVGDAEGIQLVDDLGTHWPPDVVVRQWGPLDLVDPPGKSLWQATATAATADPAGQLYESERESDDTLTQPVPPYVDGYATEHRAGDLVPAHAATW